MQSEKSGSETQKALQKKTEELIQNSTKLNEMNDLIGSFKDVQKANEEQIQHFKDEIEQGKVAYKKVNSVKEGLDKEIRTLREASKNSTDEVKRLSGSISTKDIGKKHALKKYDQFTLNTTSCIFWGSTGSNIVQFHEILVTKIINLLLLFTVAPKI